ncbi:MAG: uridine kinase [Psittacicella sp.]
MKDIKIELKKNETIIIGIAGASSSGKTLFANTICKELSELLSNDLVGIISEDLYYKDQSCLSYEERTKTNYDHPNSMDHELLIEHLKLAKEGKSLELPVYSYIEHNRTPETIPFSCKKIIILEGILILTDPKIRELLDISIFIDTPLDTCFIRRLKRDIKERGRDMESVIEQYQATVRPMFLEFIEPSKQYVDLVVPRGGKNRIAIEMVKTNILHLFKNGK